MTDHIKSSLLPLSYICLPQHLGILVTITELTMAASLNFIPFLIRAILFHNLGDQNDKNYPKYNTKNFVLITQYSPLPWQWAILFTKGYSWQQSTDYDFRNFLSWHARAMTRSKQEMNYHSTNLGHQLRHCMLWNYSKIFLKLAEFFFKATN